MTDTTTTVHNVSINLLRQWSIFGKMDEEDLDVIKSFHSFETPSHLGCRGGRGVIVITIHDEIFGMGHNCAFVNILGFHKADPEHGQETVSEMSKISTLSHKRIHQISIGGLIGAALTTSGTLYWWGNCYDRTNGDLMAPHIPRIGRRQYIRVSCGHRLLTALATSGSVYVWGQVVHNNSKFVEGERVLVGSSITDISCGLHHLAMLDVDGFVYTWGRGDEGQRGVAGYNVTDQYRVTKVSDEPCIAVKAGPYSTFCITAFHELKVCGSNRHLHLGLYQRHPVTTLTSLCLDGAVTDIFVVGLSDHTTIMGASTSDGDFYTWGEAHTPYPRLAEAGSFIEVFITWNLTPELTFIRSAKLVSWSLPRRTEESNLISDVLVYIYLRDRPDFVYESSRFLWKSKGRNLAYLASQITSEESGRAFVLDKFLKDLHTKHQLLPSDDENNDFEDDVCCSCPYHPFGGSSFYV